MYDDVMADTVNYWEESHLSSMNALDCLRNYEQFGELDLSLSTSEHFWRKDLKSSTHDSPFDSLIEPYQQSVFGRERTAMIFTLCPDKTFIVIIDEEGNQMLLDSHVHYTDNDLSFEEALNSPDCRGVVAFCAKQKACNMLQFILGSFCRELRASNKEIDVLVLRPKN